VQEACQGRAAALSRARRAAAVKLLTSRRAGHGRPPEPSFRHLKNGRNRELAWALHHVLRVFPHVVPVRPVRTAGGERRMMMMASEKLFGLHATALQLRSQRMMLIASNIANAATPNYKARDLDFSKALDLAQQQGGATGQALEGAVAYRVPVQSSLDGNTVEMATEQTAFAENALAYRSSLAFLQGRIGTLTRALKGE
jgi:flagellar basal-body rod protein FlgB